MSAGLIGAMSHDNSSFRKLATTSQRLNVGLFCALLLTLSMIGTSYWAVQRLLREEGDKIRFHFSRLMGDIREHEDFLTRISRQSDDVTRQRDQEVIPLQRRMLLREGELEIHEGREFSFAMPFILATRGHSPPVGQARGPFSLGIQVTNFYSSFWSASAYPAPQVLLIDTYSDTSIAIPALSSAPGRGGLARDTYFEVVERISERVRQHPPGDQDARVHWGRAAQYQGDSTSLLGYVALQLSDNLWWDGVSRRHIIASSQLDLNRVNDFEHLLGSAPFGEMSLISPTGERMAGPDVEADLEDGLNITRRGMLFKLRSQPEDGWVAVYRVEYPRFFRYARWPLLGLSLLLVVGVLGGSYGLRWYARRVVRPASEAHRDVVESEAFSRTIIQTAPVALCVLSHDGQQVRVVMQNQLATEWLGDAATIVELTHGWVVFADDILLPGPVCTLVDRRYLQAAFAPTRYQGRDGALCVFNDVTAHRDAEGALAEAKRLADAANAAKSLFLASMSHEIRTPLYGVLGTLELLELTQLDARQRGYLQTIQRSSGTLLQLISDILDVSKIEAGQMVLAPVEFSPLELMEEVLASYAASAAAKGLQFYGCVDPNVPDWVLGDVARIRQILGNLISNALKFTEVGRVVMRLHRLADEEGRVSLQWQVTDTGIGIAEDKQGRLFERFYQVEGQPNTVSGTGLGLAICWRLAQMMEGSLRVVSESGLGSSFSLALALPRVSSSPAVDWPALAPLRVYLRAPVRELAQSLEQWLLRWGCQVLSAPPQSDDRAGVVLLDVLPESLPPQAWEGTRVQLAPVAGVQPLLQEDGWWVSLYNLHSLAQALALARSGEASPPPAPVPMAHLARLGLRVLVAEDNPVNQALLREQLEELGCDVRLANDGREALQQFDSDAFDVVLTDANMPNMTGYELTQAIRQRDARIPVIGVTANALREEGERCSEVGMNAWLVKPMSLRTLYDALRHLQGRAPALEPVVEGSEDRLQVPLRMRELFQESMGRDLQSTRMAQDNGDAEGTRLGIHRMAGALAVVRAQALVGLCRDVEDALLDGRLRADDKQVRGLLTRIGKALQEA